MKMRGIHGMKVKDGVLCKEMEKKGRTPLSTKSGTKKVPRHKQIHQLRQVEALKEVTDVKLFDGCSGECVEKHKYREKNECKK